MGTPTTNHSVTRATVAVVAFCAVLGLAVPAAGQVTFTVTNTNDSGPGSLRQAMLDANASTGTTDTIAFNIPGAGPHTIQPASLLPTVTRSGAMTSLPGTALERALERRPPGG